MGALWVMKQLWRIFEGDITYVTSNRFLTQVLTEAGTLLLLKLFEPRVQGLVTNTP